MESIIAELLDILRTAKRFDDEDLAKVIHRHNRGLADNARHYSKKRLLPYYLKVKEGDAAKWESWNVDDETERRLLRVLQMKPRRTASGVATITVITKPFPCSSNCLYCPNDVRMPKSYLSDEPACQRAERNFFDPYLQVTSRLRALTHMGHLTDKVELIVLGGTWNDYSRDYQVWFVRELFRALNDGAQGEHNATQRRQMYKQAGVSYEEETLQAFAAEMQQQVDEGCLTYNQAVEKLYADDAHERIAADQKAKLEELYAEQRRNESAEHRVVGLVIETRPDTISRESLQLIRRLGCTKVQMGIQSLDSDILRLNHRAVDIETIREAFALLRLFGFKIHIHFMVNLYGSSPEADKADYLKLVTEASYLPDEVKLYPCVLTSGTKLCARYDDGSWRPYTEEELVDVLVADTLATPPYVRISRMIRDISAPDIIAGNKKTNLRQMVEGRIEQTDAVISEIRHREISTATPCVGELELATVFYETTVADELFLQWVTTENRIAGFLRLSLPYDSKEAMIREVHVYGRVAGLHQAGDGTQHLGLGRRLIAKACDIARERGFESINVISSVGTREYYRGLGFADGELYQNMPL